MITMAHHPALISLSIVLSQPTDGTVPVFTHRVTLPGVAAVTFGADALAPTIVSTSPEMLESAGTALLQAAAALREAQAGAGQEG